MSYRLVASLAAAALLGMTPLGRADEAPADGGIVFAAAAADSTAPARPAYRTHRLAYGLVGALVGTGVGIGVGALIISGHHSELESLWYLVTVPAGLLVGTIVGVAIGGTPQPVEPSAAFDPGAVPIAPAVRVAATVRF